MSLTSASWLEDQGRTAVGACFECGAHRYLADLDLVEAWLTNHETEHRPHLARKVHQPAPHGTGVVDIRADRAMRRRIYNETVGELR